MANSQQSLFDDDPAPWELDAAAQQMLATVVLTTGPDNQYDYLVPDELLDARRPETLLEVGRRVRVPFGRGNRTAVGYCVALGVKEAPGRKLKSVAGVLDKQSLLTPHMLRLTRWMADYYLCPWGQVLEAVVPAGVRGQAGTREMTLLSLPTRVAARLTTLDVTDKQRAVLQALAASPKPLTLKQLATRVGCTSAPINTLRKQGLIESSVERLDQGELAALEVQRETPKQLNNDQTAVLTEIHRELDAAQHSTLLIHGVTGSGKTEVYIQAIEKVVSFGRQAIVLVPEISLTPQTVGRFRARFDHIAVLHSHLTDVERHRHWKRIAAGEVQVVVGARSAVFAPTPDLGLIVVDEEHETTFKQDSAPRYHARDVAQQRAADENVPLILGSATPSLESWQRAASGEYRLLSMPRRVNDWPMPAVRLVDLREDQNRRGSISRPLQQAMEHALRDGGQAILLLNRRGFSTHVQCPACGASAKCPECEIALTFHRHEQILLCHWCDHRQAPPRACPDCRSPAIRYGGLGTQKLEAEVQARFPKARCLRMDADTMRRPGSHEQALDAFRRGEYGVLLGTQMIAKGLDFPNVTVVGVINADTALNWPDFRAGERTFHLVTQVAGRTGRGEKGGRVLVQTFDPEHPAIAAAARHDYGAFARTELPQREALGYPPFGSMIRFVCRGENESQTSAVADQAVAEIRAAWGQLEQQQPDDPLRLRGPAPAPIAKLRGEFRYHLQATHPDGPRLKAAVKAALAKLTPPEGVRWVVDVDPWEMM
ncbi:replication restart helicase PriA [Posidoniimonas corsicana]|uniref:replication restart helicase PriA n=1 Tax=Posidoniimonas corsicana TaxID=1938618 RepID=UPI001E2F307A|nr:primosomal protein N' [Posidoniimonas corsicana]